MFKRYAEDHRFKFVKNLFRFHDHSHVVNGDQLDEQSCGFSKHTSSARGSWFTNWCDNYWLGSRRADELTVSENDISQF
jgi:hypothetical protein